MFFQDRYFGFAALIYCDNCPEGELGANQPVMCVKRRLPRPDHKCVWDAVRAHYRSTLARALLYRGKGFPSGRMPEVYGRRRRCVVRRGEIHCLPPRANIAFTRVLGGTRQVRLVLC